MNTIYADSNYIIYLQGNMIRIQFGNLETDDSQEVTPHTELVLTIDNFISGVVKGNELIEKLIEAGVFPKPKKKRATRRKKN